MLPGSFNSPSHSTYQARLLEWHPPFEGEAPRGKSATREIPPVRHRELDEYPHPVQVEIFRKMSPEDRLSLEPVGNLSIPCMNGRIGGEMLTMMEEERKKTMEVNHGSPQ